MTLKELNTKDFNEYVSQDDMREYIAKLVEDLKKDIEVYEQIKALDLTIGEVKSNIAKLTDFKDDYNYCKNCPGIEKCSKGTPHIRMSISKDHNYIVASYVPCEKIMEQIRLNNKYLRADFPDEWKTSSIATLDLSENRRPLIKEFTDIIDGSSNRWLYALGNHKVGKSFLFATFANEFASLGLGQVAFVNTTNLIKSLTDLSYADKEEYARQIVLLSKVPLLIFDDFGEEYKNEYIRDQILIPLLSEREHANNLTFFISEFSIDEIRQMYSIGQASGKIRARQLANILESMCGKEFNLSGASIYRK